MVDFSYFLRPRHTSRETPKGVVLDVMSYPPFLVTLNPSELTRSRGRGGGTGVGVGARLSAATARALARFNSATDAMGHTRLVESASLAGALGLDEETLDELFLSAREGPLTEEQFFLKHRLLCEVRISLLIALAVHAHIRTPPTQQNNNQIKFHVSTTRLFSDVLCLCCVLGKAAHGGRF